MESARRYSVTGMTSRTRSKAGQPYTTARNAIVLNCGVPDSEGADSSGHVNQRWGSGRGQITTLQSYNLAHGAFGINDKPIVHGSL
jgi:hypothetical protein